jgi:hypothetical protein
MTSQAAGFQPPMNDNEEPQAQQREVERLLGRCLLRLQQYEHLMKAIVAHHDLSGRRMRWKKSVRRASTMLPPRHLAPWWGNCSGPMS